MTLWEIITNSIGWLWNSYCTWLAFCWNIFLIIIGLLWTAIGWWWSLPWYYCLAILFGFVYICDKISNSEKLSNIFSNLFGILMVVFLPFMLIFILFGLIVYASDSVDAKEKEKREKEMERTGVYISPKEEFSWTTFLLGGTLGFGASKLLDKDKK